MKNVKLFIYNYGTHQIADFKNNFHDAAQCMQLMNDSLVATYGSLPECIFYYITYKVKSSGNTLHYLETKNVKLELSEVDKRIAKLNLQPVM